jgi:hypothetical protein
MRIVLACITCLSIFSACTKSSTEGMPSLVGSWELRYRIGGWAQDSSFAAGNGNIYKFTAKNYQHYNHGQLVESGTYRLEADSMRVGNMLAPPVYEKVHRLIFNTNPTTRVTIKIQGDFFIHNYYSSQVDGVERKYVKL